MRSRLRALPGYRPIGWLLIGLTIAAGTGFLHSLLPEQPTAPSTSRPLADRATGINPQASAADLAARAPEPLSPAVAPPASEATAARAKIAIIIDDVGNRKRTGERLLALPGALTLSILPASPYGAELAQLATTAGKEVMLHAPMEPIAHPSWDGGLSRGMDQQELTVRLRDMLATLPTVRGINNHMGSALTQDRQALSWIMQEIAQRDLFFVDSRTTALSQAYDVARLYSVPSRQRDVFLDHRPDTEAIAGEFARLIALAKQQGSALAIGHPYPQTLAFLEQVLPKLEAHDVELVPVSQILTPIWSPVARNDANNESTRQKPL